MNMDKPRKRRGRPPLFSLEDMALAMELKEAGLSYRQIAAKWDSGKSMSHVTAYYMCNPRSKKRKT